MKITIYDGIPDLLALNCVSAVVQQGKISQDSKGNKHYCWVTKVPTYKCTILVQAVPYRKDDCFKVSIDPDWIRSHPDSFKNLENPDYRNIVQGK